MKVNSCLAINANKRLLQYKRYSLLSLVFVFVFCLCSLAQQVPVTSPSISGNEQQLESVTEINTDVETEDDSYIQSLEQFLKDPVNLNTADESDLKELIILTPLQIQSILSYRNILGKFIEIYELQAIPGWDINTIEKIRSFVTVIEKENVFSSIKKRLTGGNSSLLLRATQVLERSKGYQLDPSATVNYYPGSPQHVFLRYRYQYKNLLQYGIVADKDAGETFFKGAHKQGFDFYSAHFFVRNIGAIRSLAIGDFTVNLGQGLTQWQSLAFTLTSDISLIKRQSAILRPYNSAGEINFHRGVGITLAKKNIEATIFASYRKIDANLVADTASRNDDYVSSFLISGYHRTSSEIADKGIQQQVAIGGNFSLNKGNYHIGLNLIQYNFKLPLNKNLDPYNLYALNGKKLGNYSFDYSYTYKNVHVFGEVAASNKMNKAFVSGLLASVASSVDLSLLYRNISKGYQSLYTNAFTENTYPTNEKGIFIGLTVRPNNFWRIDAYADFFKYPWLRYLTDAPTHGTGYLVQATYKPNKQLELYVKYRNRSTASNFNPEEYVLAPVITKQLQNLRTQFNYRLDASILLRSRVEMSWFDKKGPLASNGFLVFADMVYKPMMKRYSGNCRLQYFETTDYYSRLYAFENDVQYSYSIPVFYDKGYRYYLNLNYDFNKKLSVWLKWAQTIYIDRKMIGSGLDEIKGNKRSEIKLQLQYLF